MSRSGRSNAGMLAALGTSVALHVGVAAMLVHGLPRTGDHARPDGVISVSIAGPIVGGDVAAASMVAAETQAVRPPIGSTPSMPAVAASPQTLQAVAPLAPAAGVVKPATSVPAIQSATSSSNLVASAVSTAMNEAPPLMPAQPPPEPSVPTQSAAAPRAEAAPARPIAVDAPTAIVLAPTLPQALEDGRAPPIGTAPMPSETTAAGPAPPRLTAPLVEAASAQPITVGAPIAVALAPTLPPISRPTTAAGRDAPQRLPDRVIGSSSPRPSIAVPPTATPGGATSVAAVDIAPVGETRPDAAPSEAHADLSASLASSHLALPAQAARPPDGAVMTHDETEAERVRIIQSFIDRYDGGPCFLMAPAGHVTSDLEVDGFATDVDTIHRFDEAFKAATGREAKIVGQWISQTQCAAVDFLRVERQGAAALKIEIERRDLRTGDVLSGTIDGGGSDPIHLYWISESGSVRDVSDRIIASGERTHFIVPVDRDIVGGPYPQLLVAIVCDGTLIPDRAGLEAGAFFAAIEAHARTTHRPLSVSGKPFRLLP